MRNALQILVISSAIIMAVLITGCVQTSENPTPAVAGSQVSPAGTSTPMAGSQSGSPNQQMNTNRTPPSGVSPGSPPAAPSGDRGDRHMLNATVLAGAAAKLGVTQQQLEVALNSTAGGPPNMTAVAEKLGVTQEKLMDALGFPQGSQMPRGDRNATAGPNGPPKTG